MRLRSFSQSWIWLLTLPQELEIKLGELRFIAFTFARLLDFLLSADNSLPLIDFH